MALRCFFAKIFISSLILSSSLTPIVSFNVFVATKRSSGVAPATFLSRFRSEAHAPAPKTRLLSSDDARSENEDAKSSSAAPPFTPFPKSPLEEGNFNPFERKPQSGVTSNPLVSSSVQSARRMRMSEVTSSLLRSVASPSEMDRILRDNEDFLLEQLEDEDAVLDLDSIYTSDMDRAERFRRYGEVMDERIEGARNGAAVKVLRNLKDFVMSFE